MSFSRIARLREGQKQNKGLPKEQARLFLDGKSVQEIMEATGMDETTVINEYRKLGRSQMFVGIERKRGAPYKKYQ